MHCKRKKLVFKKNVMVMVFVLLCCMVVGATDLFATVYVKVDGSVQTSGDGLTWDTAKKTIQDAMWGSYGDPDVEIWVRAGTYTKAANYSVFEVRWPKIYGGFDGSEETAQDRDSRDWRTNQTILDGSGTYYCVYVNNFSGDVTIDGFTMAGASRKTISVFCSSTVLLISNCIFEDNDLTSYSTGSVVGITVCQHRTTRLVLYNCVFDNNKGKRGSVVDIQHSYPSTCYLYIINSTLINNTAVGFTYGDGTIAFGATINNQGDYGNGYAYIYNSILWNNSYITDDTVNDFSHYLNQNSFVEGIQGGDPGLADIGNGDVHLVPGSYCIDSGTDNFTAYVPASIISRLGDKDFEGDDRFIGHAQDIGADEFPYEGDTDFDGVPDDEEMGPDGSNPDYDGNNDAIPDSQQGNVASLYSHDGANYFTLAVPGEAILRDVQAVESPSPGTAPEGVEFPFGCVAFTITNIPSDGHVAAHFYLPEGSSPSTYWQYGPTPDDSDSHWYEFLFDTATGARFDGNEIILHFIDGQQGDHDLAVNGTIVDPGAPGLESSGTIIIGKQTDPYGAPDSFTFTPSYAPLFFLADGETHNSGPLPPGSYTVLETNIPSGWSLTSATCDDGSNPNAINLDPGETVTCTFTNTQESSGCEINEIPGDLDGDCDVDSADRTIFRNALRTCLGDPNYNPDADYDTDGCITFKDYRQWLKYYKIFLSNPT